MTYICAWIDWFYLLPIAKPVQRETMIYLTCYRVQVTLPIWLANQSNITSPSFTVPCYIYITPRIVLLITYYLKKKNYFKRSTTNLYFQKKIFLKCLRAVGSWQWWCDCWTRHLSSSSSFLSKIWSSVVSYILAFLLFVFVLTFLIYLLYFLCRLFLPPLPFSFSFSTFCRSFSHCLYV